MTQLTRDLLAVLLFLAAACLAQLLWHRPTGLRRADRSFSRLLRRSLFALLFYITAGVVLAYARHPRISDAYAGALDPGSFYGSSPCGQRVALISDSQQALDLRLQLIANAKRSVLLSTYDIRDDESGTDLAAFLLEAADRGVRVSLLTDGFNAIEHTEYSPVFRALAAHENITHIVYSPLDLFRPWQLMGRMHEKYLLVDDEYLLTGGRNSHNAFLGRYGSAQNLDLDVLVCGSGGVLAETRDYFQSITGLDCCKPHVQERSDDKCRAVWQSLREHAAVRRAADPEAFLPYDDSGTLPANAIHMVHNPNGTGAKEPQVWYALMALLGTAREQAEVHTPYLVCNRAMYEDLTRAAAGCDLRITLNSPQTSANLFGSGVYLNEKQNILRTGASILEYQGGSSSHTKALCIDDRLAVVGSFNFDMRSAYLDTELMLVVDSPALAQQLKSYMAAVNALSVPAEGPESYSMPPMRDLLLSVMRLFERPFRFLL